MQSRQQLQQMFRDLNRIQQIMRRKQTPSVAQGEKWVLHYLAQMGGQAQPGTISQAMGVSTARIAAVLGSLERKGEVVRTPQLQDRRCVMVTLTDCGRVHLQTIYDTMLEQMQILLDALGPEDAQQLMYLVHRLPAIMECMADTQKGDV